MTRNSVANKILPEDRPFHDWYRFVLSYPPHLVRDYLDKFEAGRRSTILDPFAGTGTTMVECKKWRYRSIGIETHPMSHFACQTKVDWTGNPDELVRSAEKIANVAARKCGFKSGGRDFLALYEDSLLATSKLRRLAEDAGRILLKDSISPLPLHKTIILREAIESQESKFTGYFRLALARTVVGDASNLNFGPEVGIGKPKSDAPVIEAWLKNMYQMASDLRGVQGRRYPATKVHLADSRNIGKIIPKESIDLVITSPPYPNEKDYTRTTRLESVILRFVQSRAELKKLKQGLMRSNTRNIYKGDNDDDWLNGAESIRTLAGEIEARRVELGKTSGFERLYHQVVLQYFGGMARHFESMKPILRRGAKLAYVVGDQASFFRILIRTGEALAEIASRSGYKVIGLDLFRTRLATATRAELREEVLLLQWNG